MPMYNECRVVVVTKQIVVYIVRQDGIISRKTGNMLTVHDSALALAHNSRQAQLTNRYRYSLAFNGQAGPTRVTHKHQPYRKCLRPNIDWSSRRSGRQDTDGWRMSRIRHFGPRIGTVTCQTSSDRQRAGHRPPQQSRQ